MPSRKTSLAALAVGFLGITGCARDPELVWVDISAPASQGVSSVRAAAHPGLQPKGGSLEAMPERSLAVGDSEETIRLAIAQIKEDQQALFQDLRERLFEQLRAEARSLNNETRDKVIAEYQAEFAAALDKISAMFAEHATVVGQKWHRLSWLSGFPDPDPRSRRIAREGDHIGEMRIDESKRLREEIALLEAQFRAETDEILNSLRDGLRADVAAIADDLEAEIEKARQQADSQAREAALKAIQDVDASALTLEDNLPALPGTSTQPRPVSGAPAEAWSTRETDLSRREQLRSLARLYAASIGAKLAESPRGAANHTQEFWNWVNEKKLGASANSPK